MHIVEHLCNEEPPGFEKAWERYLDSEKDKESVK